MSLVTRNSMIDFKSSTACTPAIPLRKRKLASQLPDDDTDPERDPRSVLEKARNAQFPRSGATGGNLSPSHIWSDSDEELLGTREHQNKNVWAPGSTGARRPRRDRNT